MTTLNDVYSLIDRQKRHWLVLAQDCQVRLSRDTLIDLLAEAHPNLNRFELDAKADTIATLYGAKIVIDDTARDVSVSVPRIIHVQFTKSETAHEQTWLLGRPVIESDDW